MNHKCQLHTYLERHLIQRWRFEALEAPFRGSSIPTRSSIPDQKCSSILKKESNAGHRCGPQPGWEIRARRVGRALTPPGIYTRRFLLTTLKTQLAVKPGVWVRYWFVLRGRWEQQVQAGSWLRDELSGWHRGAWAAALHSSIIPNHNSLYSHAIFVYPPTNGWKFLWSPCLSCYNSAAMNIVCRSLRGRAFSFSGSLK